MIYLAFVFNWSCYVSNEGRESIDDMKQGKHRVSGWNYTWIVGAAVVGGSVKGLAVGDGVTGTDVVGRFVGSEVTGVGVGRLVGASVIGVAVGTGVAGTGCLVGESVIGASVGFEVVGILVVGELVAGTDGHV